MPPNFTITLLPLTGGDATLLTSATANILVDTGEKADEAVSYLRRLSLERIDLLVLSHIDLDHIGGLLQLVNQIPIDRIWCFDIYGIRAAIDRIPPADLAGDARQAARYMTANFVTIDKALQAAQSRSTIHINCVEEGHSEAIGQFRFDVLWPPREYVDYVLEPRMLARWISDVAVRPEWLSPSHRKFAGEDLRRARHNLVDSLGSMPDLPPGPDPGPSADAPPWPGRKFANNLSTVLSVRFDSPWRQARILLPGDLEDWSGLLVRHIDAVPSPLWKIPHPR